MKNRYEIRGNVTAIFLVSKKYGEMETLIDTEDLEKVKKLPNKWFADCHRGKFYVKGHYTKVNGKQPKVKLHRVLTDAPRGMLVDHIDRNALNNCKSNLRIATHSINTQNVGANKNSKTGIRGVSWHSVAGKWSARLMVNKVERTLGYYDDIDEAKLVVERARAKLMEGSIEYLNEPDRDSIVVTYGLGDKPTNASRTGIRGIGWNKNQRKWKARFQHNNKQVHVGYYDDFQEAIKELEKAKKQAKSS